MEARLADPDPLPDDVPTLKAMVRELLATIAELRLTVGAQQRRIDDLTRRLYGRKSERLPDVPPSSPDPLPPDPPLVDTPARLPGHGRKPLPAHLPRERVEHDLTDAEKACPGCGGPRVRIGAQTCEQLDYRPASLVVIEHARPTYACPDCSRSSDPADGAAPTITTAAGPSRLIDKGLPGPGLLAHVVTAKYADHLPLYRLEGILARHGVTVARSTMGDWVAAVADWLRPLTARMAASLLQSRVVQTDDTPVPVLEPGSKKTRTGHLWVYLGDGDHPYAVFDYTATYTGDGPRKFFGGYAGYIQADALKQYDALFTPPKGKAAEPPHPRPTEVGCWAHARRKFFEARGSDPPRAHEALARIRGLYDVEDRARDFDGARRAELRLRESVPALAALFGWLLAQRPQVLPKSPMGLAIRYALSNRCALESYAGTGFLAIDNNASERALRGVAVGRKNYLFAGSDRGGATAAVLYSVVGSCRRLAIDPFVYLRDALTRLPTLEAEQLDELLPDRWMTARGKAAT
jgi:transposase